jgi:type II pantothenate kinase
MIVGLDIGASFAKIILVDKNLKIIDKHILPVNEPKTFALRITDFFINSFGGDYKGIIDAVVASGGGSRFIGDKVLGLPVRRVDEVRAIGLGGLLLAKRSEGLIASAGTGTALVAAYGEGRIIKHVGGTGVGGGTIIGLSRRILGVTDFETLENMALSGNANEVDLTVGDIVGGPIGIVPAEATASNLAKLAHESNPNDIAAGIFNMVSQTIGVVAAIAAKAYGLEDSVIITGMLARSRVASKIMCETARLFSVAAYVPENCEFSNALGAAASIIREGNI